MSNELTTNVNQQNLVKVTDDNSLFSSKNFKHYHEMAQHLAKSTMIPKGYSGKPMDILIAMEMGAQLGIPTIQAIQDIAVINGKPCMYGDGLLAVVQGHPHYEYITETPILESNKIIGYQCVVKRKGHPEHISVFTAEQAKKAGLWGKQGPWSQYPERMLQMRARGYALRDTFADALRGIKPAEEARDYIDVTPAAKKPAKDFINDLVKKPINEPVKVIADVAEIADVEQPRNRLDLMAYVEELLISVEFPQERLVKALKHYNVSDLENLTKDQLFDFSLILQRELLKKSEEFSAQEIDPETGEVIQ